MRHTKDILYLLVILGLFIYFSSKISNLSDALSIEIESRRAIIEYASEYDDKRFKDLESNVANEHHNHDIQDVGGLDERINQIEYKITDIEYALSRIKRYSNE